MFCVMCRISKPLLVEIIQDDLKFTTAATNTDQRSQNVVCIQCLKELLNREYP